MIEENEKQEDLPLELEIEIEEETPQETSDVVETKTEEEKDSDYGKRVQKRIKALVEQKRESDKESAGKDQIVKNLQERLARLEHGASSAAQEQFTQNYSNVKTQMQKAIEEGDTAKQVEYSEQLADIKATLKVQELQHRQQQIQRTQSPTVGRAAQPQAPQKAMILARETSFVNDYLMWYNILHPLYRILQDLIGHQLLLQQLSLFRNHLN